MSKQAWSVLGEDELYGGIPVIEIAQGKIGPSFVSIGYVNSAEVNGNLILTSECWERARLIAAAPDLLDALRDMLSGWKYIRDVHGDLYGVGWDRAQGKAEAALAKAQGSEHV